MRHPEHLPQRPVSRSGSCLGLRPSRSLSCSQLWPDHHVVEGCFQPCTFPALPIILGFKKTLEPDHDLLFGGSPCYINFHTAMHTVVLPGEELMVVVSTLLECFQSTVSNFEHPRR